MGHAAEEALGNSRCRWLHLESSGTAAKPPTACDCRVQGEVFCEIGICLYTRPLVSLEWPTPTGGRVYMAGPVSESNGTHARTHARRNTWRLQIFISSLVLQVVLLRYLQVYMRLFIGAGKNRGSLVCMAWHGMAWHGMAF